MSEPTHQFSFAIKVETEEEKYWWASIADLLESILADEELTYEQVSASLISEDEFLAITNKVPKREDPSGVVVGSIPYVELPFIVVHSTEEGETVSASLLCQLYLRRFRPDGYIVFNWVTTTEAMTVDSFIGAACIVTASDVFYKYLDTFHGDFARSTELVRVNYHNAAAK